MCKSIQVEISDSMINRFVSKEEVKGILINSKLKPLGEETRKIDLYQLEKLLDSRSAIKKGDVSIDRNGDLSVKVTQRRPVLRINAPQGGFYVDQTGYIFPLVHTFTSYVPIVSGNLPVNLGVNYRGNIEEEHEKWMNQLISLGTYLSKNEFWNAQIQQIYIEEGGDVILYTRVGDQSINFGSLDDIEFKFAKLNSYYQNIVPVYGWNRYSNINLKYSDQIICTLKKKNNKNLSI